MLMITADFCRFLKRHRRWAKQEFVIGVPELRPGYRPRSASRLKQQRPVAQRHGLIDVVADEQYGFTLPAKLPDTVERLQWKPRIADR